MVIVDTTVLVDYLNDVSTPEVEWLERESTRQRLGVLDVMLCEVLQGLSTDAEAATVLRDLIFTAWLASAEPAAPRTGIVQPNDPANPRYSPATGSAFSGMRR